MDYMQVGDIRLQYDKQLVDIKKISKIIEFNQYLFENYKGKTVAIGLIDPSAKYDISIPFFYNFFDNRLKEILQNKHLMTSLNHPDILPALYIQLLIKKANQQGASVVMLDNEISDDMLWFMIACKFYDYRTSFNKLSDFLKYRHNSEYIFNWLKETQRFPTYNYLLKVASNYLREYDLSFFDNMREIISRINEESITWALSISNESTADLPKINLDSFEQIFLNFLERIKAPERWKNGYIKLKKEKKILFEESVDGLEHSEVFQDHDGIKKIRVTMDGTIKYFVSFVHEFIHYISLNGEMTPFSLVEFPSIYYEKVAENYLVEIGYDKKIINQVIKERNQNNLDLISSLFGILIDICKYNEQGIITKEEKIKSLKASMEIIYETRKNLAKICEEEGAPIRSLENLNPPNYNDEELVNQECDENIIKFIKNGALVLNGYQYLTDSYLADSILKRQDSDDTPDKMIFITEHLEDFNIEKIMDTFEINRNLSLKSKNRKE